MNCPDAMQLAVIVFKLKLNIPLSRDEEVLRHHVDACGECRGALKQTVETVQGLAEHAGDTGQEACLDQNTLAEYLDDVLPAAHRESAEAHLAGCGQCRSQLTDAFQALNTLEPDTGPLEILIRVAKFGLKIITPPAPGFSPLAASAQAMLGPATEGAVVQWRQRLREADLLVTAERGEGDHISLSFGIDAFSSPWHGARLTLRQDGAMMQSENFPDSGSLTLHNLGLETYEVEIAFGTGESHTFLISLALDLWSD